ncbi:hypothetical protein I2W78_39035 [Streptomyces spinoverrucosus]|uniref:hypothetical protein n=1 Tax=Streptomyces spinoverrucosus TaxID=284043 RepID=UPI0018C446CB|nr:hypothetical protein [Streptomyces spinoverrucosus]MBG0857686.1 hypothetical protein [Streptomyces spinoverrucosus]
MSTPVDAEQAWKDLQRIRVPQERVYDEVERSASGGPGATYATAAIMWVFLAGLGLDPPKWGVWLALAVYLTVLGALARTYNRRSRMRLHHSRCSWRMFATFVAGAVVTGGTIVLSGRMVESLKPMSGSLIQATVSAAVFVLFVGPAGRWAVGSLRGRGEPAARVGAGR